MTGTKKDANKDSLYSISDDTLEILENLPEDIREEITKAVKQEREDAVVSTYQQTIVAVNHYIINCLTQSMLRLQLLVPKLEKVDGLESEISGLIEAYNDMSRINAVLRLMSETEHPTSTTYHEQTDMIYIDESKLEEITRDFPHNLES
ncbi:hypothetical protein CEE44_01185 [Candidatus Woesearchaeota archaeon B3_Woes]|nr:MAG: hypothetical protein CEE44_01185 [Candidatus Woesearchaeota archaeon B3_Woes]